VLRDNRGRFAENGAGGGSGGIGVELKDMGDEGRMASDMVFEGMAEGI